MQRTMNLELIGATFLALAVVATGAAGAVPGNAPVDVPTGDYDGQGGDASNASEQRPADAAATEYPDRRGPPADLPGDAPDFVSEVHDLIRSHLDDALDGVLGDRISDVSPDEGERADIAGDQSGGNATFA